MSAGNAVSAGNDRADSSLIPQSLRYGAALCLGGRAGARRPPSLYELRRVRSPWLVAP
jgi:hypothetical protein